MKQAVNFYEFRKAFNEIRPNNFSHEGLAVLFDWFRAFEEETNTEIDLDVIAVCCDYTQSTITEALNDYGLNNLDELVAETIVMSVNDNEIIYLNY